MHESQVTRAMVKQAITNMGEYSPRGWGEVASPEKIITACVNAAATKLTPYTFTGQAGKMLQLMNYIAQVEGFVRVVSINSFFDNGVEMIHLGVMGPVTSGWIKKWEEEVVDDMVS